MKILPNYQRKKSCYNCGYHPNLAVAICGLYARSVENDSVCVEYTLNKYEYWVVQNSFDTPATSALMCVEACNSMVDCFPELSLKRGVVYSKTNADNCSDDHFTEYPHTWCETPEGDIVDPTKAQFHLLGELIYREIDEEDVRKCMGCGTFYSESSSGLYGLCGQCKWSRVGLE